MENAGVINSCVDYPCMHLVSKSIVTPPSNSNLKTTYKLSFFDQMAPPIYIPSIFFYEGHMGLFNDDNARISQKLRESLSDTLTSFYPLIGKLDVVRGMVLIDWCNDGVEVMETRVDARLSDVVRDPNIEELMKRFLPRDPHDVPKGDDLFCVQVNFFECGGIAIGICLSHKIADATSLFTFMNAWATVCRGGELIDSDYNLGIVARRFPAADLLHNSNNLPRSLFSREGELLTTKRFLFDKEKVASLRARSTSSLAQQLADHDRVMDPTRVELVSAFIWKHLMTLNGKCQAKKTYHSAVHAVNLRARTSLVDQDRNSQCVFGNYFLYAFALGGDLSEAHSATIDELVSKLRDAIRSSFDVDEFLRKLEMGDSNQVAEMLDLISETEEMMEIFGFTSWCRFPVYDVDFGWGKPVWISPSNFSMKTTVLMDTKCGEGIEAWMNVPQDYGMEDLEFQFKLLGNVQEN